MSVSGGSTVFGNDTAQNLLPPILGGVFNTSALWLSRFGVLSHSVAYDGSLESRSLRGVIGDFYRGPRAIPQQLRNIAMKANTSSHPVGYWIDRLARAFSFTLGLSW